MIELHLHLDGSLSPSTIKKLAIMNNITLSSDYKSKLSVKRKCKDLNEYLECFKLPLSLLQTKESITFAVTELLKDLRKLGLIYAEIRFAPLLHLNKGLSIGDVVKAAIAGLDQNILKSNLILCMMRGARTDLNMDTIKEANKYLGKGVCGIDLAGAEALYKTELYEGLFYEARRLGIPFTIHAGEADGASSVDKAIEFKASRIGHGIKAKKSLNTVMNILDKDIVLEMCPTSNLQTKAVDNILNYPLKEYLDKSIKVTINSDNTTVSNTNINKEYSLVKNELNISKIDIYNMLCNSIDYSFADNNLKKELKDLLNIKFNDWYNSL